MGYPNKRVSMTDVHGEPQQGGYLPAEIWHAYMAAVTEGESCTEFPTPKEQISYQPFFGKYASTGASSSSESENESGKSEPGHIHTHTPSPVKAPNVEHTQETPSPPSHEPVQPAVKEAPPTVGGAGGAESPKH